MREEATNACNVLGVSDNPDQQLKKRVAPDWCGFCSMAFGSWRQYCQPRATLFEICRGEAYAREAVKGCEEAPGRVRIPAKTLTWRSQDKGGHLKYRRRAWTGEF